MSIKKVLITGATGFIGKALMAHYQSQSIETIGIDLLSDDNSVIKADITKPDTYIQHLEGVDLIIHTASLVSNVASADLMWEVNVKATRVLAEKAIEYNVKRFVYLSSVSAFGFHSGTYSETSPVRPKGNEYVLTKISSEHVLQQKEIQSNIEVVIIRPSGIYGPECRVWVDIPLKMIKKGLFLLPKGGRFNPLYISDLVDGTVLAASVDDAAGETFILANEDNVPVEEFYSYHYKFLGKTSKPKVLPYKLTRHLAQAFFRLYSLLGLQTEASGSSIDMMSLNRIFVTTKAQDILGFKPKVSLDEGMQHVKAYLKDTGAI